MNNKYYFEALNISLLDLRDNYEQPFEGMTAALGGDFLTDFTCCNIWNKRTCNRCN